MALRSEGLKAVDDHGGSLERAGVLFPGAPQPWIDLSTGINPHPYPLFAPPATALTRLPEEKDVTAVCALAARAYGAPSGENVTVAGGTQILLPLVASLVPAGRALVLGPTYAEHARAAALAGHRVGETDAFEHLARAGLAIVVNPNNPDGRVVRRAALLDLARTLRAKGGLLVVDEAFMDVGPREESLAGDTGGGNIVVLRSFGKFFGLAGVRLGFALAAPETAARLRAWLGPWAVSGPALAYGARALADRQWQEAMRNRLAAEAEELERLFERHGFRTEGGTSLYRFLRNDRTQSLFRFLGERGILTRCFKGRPRDLRVGLPAEPEGMLRLEEALAQWPVHHPSKEHAG
jgi:cobalamin biosynthetic protein CobC